MIDLRPVRGTRDFYPPQLRLRQWLFDIWRRTSAQFGFEEYDACILESEALYVRKAGDEITEQLYSFQDKGNRRLALRPEMTPTLARLILQREKALGFPLKWFSIPQCFRYERMTRGRKREHYQWNLDIVGQPGNVAEVEVISALIMSLAAMGLGASHVRLHVNDRRLLGEVLDHIGIPAERHLPVMVVMDKRDKVAPESLAAMLAEQGLTGPQLEKLNAFLAMEGLDEVQHALGDESAGARALDDLLSLMGRVGFGDTLVFDITVVRGLSYYTGTVFELRDRSASLRAICGGGRYDSLLSTYGGPEIPAIGFGFGDVVILELLGDLDLLPDLRSEIDYVVFPFSDEQVPAALEISQQLRRKGYRADADFGSRKLKRALQRAGDMGARHAILLMPDEMARGEIVVRDLERREEQRVGLDAFLEGLG